MKNLTKLNIKVAGDSYVIDGKKYPRVTRILDIIAKPEFYRWYAKHGVKKCNQIRDDKAAFGTRMHKEIQNDLEDRNVWLDSKEMRNVFEIFRDWKEEHKIVPECLECHVFSDELMCGGTCDFVGDFDGKNILLDWKTSPRVYDSYPLQVSVYLYMYEKMHNVILDGAGVICFTPKGVKEKYFTRAECLMNMKVFRAARTLYRWKYGR